ncbi:acyl carrier protein [Nocardia terpenica]|uniref:acyl carrier protein n=1 Tax=Nocardia terpenica TaxID=455432 RepID=UPI00189387A0|nr:acyl carrier protein [Nocardia terpenica]MBF6063308.1 acyl carrier protein [Nocardia terpenica]MBF6105864.1 acyl carrier protein [Nocardia terpenica]MBF6113552.1 acyl carrier protein [Nocardia terpenica]MBF6119605.1 acyl carrier protein [Nocardia terpenica]MBF6152016.1 acyl carrier protein [Nocardia terpenica]
MEHTEIVEVIRKYLVEEVLEGSATNLTADAPLLEWGVLSSLSTIRLVSFIAERFGVTVPTTEVVGQNFKDLDSIATLVSRLDADPAAQEPGADSCVIPAGRPA